MYVRAGLRLLLTPFSDSRDSTYYLGHHVTRAYVSGERALSLSHSQSLRTARAIYFPNFRRCPALAECVARRAREAPRARRPPRGVAKVLPVYPPKQQRLTITHGYVLASMYIQHLRLLRIVIRLALSRAPHCEALFRPAPSNVFWLHPEFSEKQRYRETRNQKQLSPLATK